MRNIFCLGGVLYGLDSKNNQLVTYDLETGEASSIGSLEMNISACGLAHDSASGRLIGATASTGEVFPSTSKTGLHSTTCPRMFLCEVLGREYDPNTDTGIHRKQSILGTERLLTFLGAMEGLFSFSCGGSISTFLWVTFGWRHR